MTKDVKITTEEFDQALSDILGNLTGGQLMTVPGVYEVVSEHFNNEALDLAKSKRARNRPPPTIKRGVLS